MACQIIYHHGNCLNNKKSFVRPCRLCVDACPHQAISEFKELNHELCTECGACMAACPSDGFVDGALGKLQDYLLRAEEVVLNCPQASPAGFEIPCIGIFDRDGWAFLVVLAYQKRVCILTGECKQCEDRGACALSVGYFQTLHRAWPDHPQIRIEVRPDNGEERTGAGERIPGERHIERIPGERQIERRDLFTGWRRKSREKIESWLPNLKAGETYQIPLFRQWLAAGLQELPDLKIPFLTLQTGVNCTGCGICEDICPQAALALQTEADGSYKLIFEPLPCVQCERCVQICQPQALSLTIKGLSHRVLTGKVLLHSGKTRHCSKCGKQVFDAEEPALCLACATAEPGERGLFF